MNTVRARIERQQEHAAEQFIALVNSGETSAGAFGEMLDQIVIEAFLAGIGTGAVLKAAGMLGRKGGRRKK